MSKLYTCPGCGNEYSDRDNELTCSKIVCHERKLTRLVEAAQAMLQHQRKHGRTNTSVFRALQAALAEVPE